MIELNDQNKKEQVNFFDRGANSEGISFCKKTNLAIFFFFENHRGDHMVFVIGGPYEFKESIQKFQRKSPPESMVDLKCLNFGSKRGVGSGGL